MMTVAVLATYNERENIGPLIDSILRLDLSSSLQIIVVDDNSPDRTWEIVQERACRDQRVHLIRRFGRKGRGLAGRDGMLHALRLGADCVIEMDADCAHNPKYLPVLLNEIQSSDVIIGSRFVTGGKDERRHVLRRMLSRCAAFYIRALLNFDIRDPASGYRCFRRGALNAVRLSEINATDPFFITEILYRCQRAGFSIQEIPIHFEDRNKGFSKLNLKIVLSYLVRVIILRFSPTLAVGRPHP